ncbi:MAG: ABC transporter permease [Phycisphaerae bacterium]|jgi:lipopolysaccharide transport system permease protein
MTSTAESIRELWRYRELFYFMVWRDIKVRYKQSILGALWAIIQPFVTMVVFTLFFNKVAKVQPPDDMPYPIFSYSALLPWTYFSSAIGQAGLSLVSNRNLLTKVYFPRVVIPASSTMRGLLDFSIASMRLAGLMVYYSFPPSWELLLWPVLVIPLLMLALGVGMLFAAVNVRYRDVQYVLPFVTQLGLFISPIIYPLDLFPERWRPILALNPLCGIIEAFRASLVPSRPIDLHLLGISLTVTVLIFAAGVFYFKRTARSFADIV